MTVLEGGAVSIDTMLEAVERIKAFTPAPGIMGPVRVVEDHNHLDWSDVRSPSRAKRRLKRGFPQRIKRAKPLHIVGANIVVMHPMDYSALKLLKNSPYGQFGL